MRIVLVVFVYIFVTNCSNNQTVYWCGNHPCINKKERESYFKKTMIVEIREIDKNYKKNDSEMDKILKQVTKDEKNRKVKEKKLAKQAKREKARMIKEEKKLAKQIELDEKKRIKEEKELAK